MRELREYRTNLIERLGEAAKAFRAECLAVEDPDVPLEENGWNVHQVAVHTRDVDKLVYGLRVRRTAGEDNPEFMNFDGDVHMAQHYDSLEPLSAVLGDLVENVGSLVELLWGLPEGAWSRVSRHTSLGTGITLQTWVERDLSHIEEHLETVRKAK